MMSDDRDGMFAHTDVEVELDEDFPQQLGFMQVAGTSEARDSVVTLLARDDHPLAQSLRLVQTGCIQELRVQVTLRPPKSRTRLRLLE